MSSRGIMNSSDINGDNLESDKVGIFLSALCCIHCMTIPLLMFFAPSLSHFFQHEMIHYIGFLIIVPLGLYAFISKLKIHENKKPLYVGLVGMLLLVASMLFHEFLGHEMGHHLEIVFSVLGGASLIWAHLMNIRLCKCRTCHH